MNFHTNWWTLNKMDCSLSYTGLIQSIEGLNRRKMDFPWARRNTLSRQPLDLNCHSSLSLQPASLPCRFWTFHASTIVWAYFLKLVFFSLSLSIHTELDRDIYTFISVSIYPHTYISLYKNGYLYTLMIYRQDMCMFT